MSSLDTSEIPLVLAVFTSRLFRLTACCQSSGSHADNKAAGGGKPEAARLLEGMNKERALVAFIEWQNRRAAEAVRGLDVFSRTEEAEKQMASEVPPAEAALSPELLLPAASTLLHGLLKSLQQLVQMQQQVLRPAAPFLVFLFSEVLRRLVPAAAEASAYAAAEEEADAVEQETGEGQELPGAAGTAAPGEAEATGEAEESASTGLKAEAEPLAATSSRHRKHCVKIAIDALHLLFNAFPDLAAAWRTLLKPVAPTLQLLLSAAVETGAVGHVGGTKGRERSPAIVRFVASWALQAVSCCQVSVDPDAQKFRAYTLGLAGSEFRVSLSGS